MEKLCRSIETYLRNEHRDMREWGSKYIGLVLRIAGLLHIAADGDEDIQMETVENAIQIGSYAFTMRCMLIPYWEQMKLLKKPCMSLRNCENSA